MPALIINNMRSIPILLLVAGLSFGDRYAPIERAVKDGTSRAPVVDILSTPVSINVRNVALPYLLSLISQEEDRRLIEEGDFLALKHRLRERGEDLYTEGMRLVEQGIIDKEEVLKYLVEIKEA